MRTRARNRHSELAHHGLDVMDDEVKALAVLREQPRIEQGARNLLLGEVARRLFADGKQQIPALPSDRKRSAWRSEGGKAQETIAMPQWNREPDRAPCP